MGQTNEEGRNETKQSLRRMTHGWDDAHKRLNQCRVTYHYKCAQSREKVTCEVYCFHPRRLQQIAISCKRSCYNKLSKKMSSTNFYPTATMKNWKTDATFGIDEKGLVLVVLLLILGGDGSL